jgi:hypothetical protein
MRLPIHQLRKGQPRPTELVIQPQAEIMQGHLRRHACLTPTEVMGPFTIETERMPELLIYRLHDLAHPTSAEGAWAKATSSCASADR